MIFYKETQDKQINPFVDHIHPDDVPVTAHLCYVTSRSHQGRYSYLVGAGDISSCENDNDEATAKLLDTIPGTVFGLDDNVYIDGTYSDFTDCRHPTWDRHKDRTKPVPGNHVFHTGRGGLLAIFRCNARRSAWRSFFEEQK